MQETVDTSPLIKVFGARFRVLASLHPPLPFPKKTRAEQVVPARMHAITQAIKARDFPTFAKITMQDSNQVWGQG